MADTAGADSKDVVPSLKLTPYAKSVPHLAPPHTHTLVVVPLTLLLLFVMVLSGPRSLPLPWWPPLPLLALGPSSLG